MNKVLLPAELMIEWAKPYIWNAEAKEWLRERPQVILDLYLRFPPDCLVKGTRPLVSPPTNGVGIVISHFEDGQIKVGNAVNDTAGMCDPSWLELVAERPGFEVDTIKAILNENKK